MSNDFERLSQALDDELELSKPSEQDFNTTLTKAKMYSDLVHIKLSQTQKGLLLKIYQKALLEEKILKHK